MEKSDEKTRSTGDTSTKTNSLSSILKDDIQLSAGTILCCIYCIAVFLFYMGFTPYFSKEEIDTATLFSKVILRIVPVSFLLLTVHSFRIIKLIKLKKQLKNEDEN